LPITTERINSAHTFATEASVSHTLRTPAEPDAMLIVWQTNNWRIIHTCTLHVMSLLFLPYFSKQYLGPSWDYNNDIFIPKSIIILSIVLVRLKTCKDQRSMTLTSGDTVIWKIIPNATFRGRAGLELQLIDNPITDGVLA
jgi:hypothetical protein